MIEVKRWGIPIYVYPSQCRKAHNGGDRQQAREIFELLASIRWSWKSDRDDRVSAWSLPPPAD
jgi:hypothetical protein